MMIFWFTSHQTMLMEDDFPPRFLVFELQVQTITAMLVICCISGSSVVSSVLHMIVDTWLMLVSWDCGPLYYPPHPLHSSTLTISYYTHNHPDTICCRTHKLNWMKNRIKNPGCQLPFFSRFQDRLYLTFTLSAFKARRIQFFILIIFSQN